MDILIVYAHPEPTFFNDAMTRAQHLAGDGKRLEAIDRTHRYFVHPTQDYGPDERLKPSVVARPGQQRNV